MEDGEAMTNTEQLTANHEQQITTLDEPRNRLWRLFLTAYATAIEQIEHDLQAAGLPPISWYDVLWTLECAPDHHMRLHELAQAVLLSRSNITRLVDRLEEAGLLCRKRCPNDRRGAYAALTPEGLALRKQIWATYSQSIGRHFANYLTDEEVTLLSNAFERTTAISKVETT
jgi:DNA-binding MarR family transcriptional regulator